jgi:MoaA/NifB/PqqE/SkfB family radical SAM enzyme
MDKAVAECALDGVGLFNWTEPLLHRDIADLVRIVQGHDVRCHLSSNLNVLRDPDILLAANPYLLRVSVSGFHQSSYGLTHRGGDVERVKHNMAVLAAAPEAPRGCRCSTTATSGTSRTRRRCARWRWIWASSSIRCGL